MLINKKMEIFCGLSIFFAKIERGPGDFGLLRQKYITYNAFRRILKKINEQIIEKIKTKECLGSYLTKIQEHQKY